MSLSKRYPHQEAKEQPPQRQKAPDYRFQALAQESADFFWCLSPAGLMQEISSSWHIFTGQEEQGGWILCTQPISDR